MAVAPMRLSEDEHIYTPCLLCGSTSFSLISSRANLADQRRYLKAFHRLRLQNSSDRERGSDALTDRDQFTQDYDTQIVACRRCGLLFRNPHPQASSVIQAYASDQYDPAHLQQEFEMQREWARTKIPLVRKWLKEKHNPRLLEIGSFVGGFLAAAREQHWTITGVDPGETVTRFCSERKLPVYRGTMETAPLRSEELDGILVWNTFDQLPNPHSMLAAAANSLKSDGLLVIRVPNGTCYRTSLSLAERHPWMQPILYPMLAWNNLLGFPYLLGYDGDSLDRVVTPHGFRREALYPDTLMTLSTPATPWWAQCEERLIKALCLSAGTVGSWLHGSGSRYRAACWLNVYYRRISNM
jgi:SAM-dependent methyltransferase